MLTKKLLKTSTCTLPFLRIKKKIMYMLCIVTVKRISKLNYLKALTAE